MLPRASAILGDEVVSGVAECAQTNRARAFAWLSGVREPMIAQVSRQLNAKRTNSASSSLEILRYVARAYVEASDSASAVNLRNWGSLIQKLSLMLGTRSCKIHRCVHVDAFPYFCIDVISAFVYVCSEEWRYIKRVAWGMFDLTSLKRVSN